MIMKLFQAIATTAGGVWLGGMVLMAIVASTTFGVMRTTGVEHPDSIAGQVMAKNFARFDTVQMTCAGVLVAWQIVHMAFGGRHGRDWLRLGLIVAAAGLLAYSVRVLTPQITDLQPALQSADPDVAMKAAFDKFHSTAVRISKINLILLLVIVVEMALPRKPEAAAHTLPGDHDAARLQT